MTLDDLKDKLRRLLIEYNGNVAPHQLSDIVREARALGLDEHEIASLVPDTDRTINWVEVKEQKKLVEMAKAQAEAHKQINEKRLRDEALVEKLVKDAFNKGIVKPNDLENIFAIAIHIELDEYALAKKINENIKKFNYKPHPPEDRDTKGLKEILLSTTWYDPTLYKKVSSQGHVSMIAVEPSDDVAGNQSKNSQPTQPSSQTPDPKIHRPKVESSAVPKAKRSSKIRLVIILGIITIICIWGLWAANSESNKEPEFVSIYKNPLYNISIENVQALTLAEKDSITTNLFGFYREDAGDGSQLNLGRLLGYFVIPVERYYMHYNLSKKRLTAEIKKSLSVLNTHYSEISKFYFLEKNTSGRYIINVQGTFHYSLRIAPQKPKTKPINDIIIMNEQYKVVSIYKSI
jgi:hypothetical protein